MVYLPPKKFYSFKAYYYQAFITEYGNLPWLTNTVPLAVLLFEFLPSWVVPMPLTEELLLCDDLELVKLLSISSELVTHHSLRERLWPRDSLLEIFLLEDLSCLLEDRSCLLEGLSCLLEDCSTAASDVVFAHAPRQPLFCSKAKHVSNKTQILLRTSCLTGCHD